MLERRLYGQKAVAKVNICAIQAFTAYYRAAANFASKFLPARYRSIIMRKRHARHGMRIFRGGA